MRGNAEGKHFSDVPVHDGYQVHKATFQRDKHYICRPHLIGAFTNTFDYTRRYESILMAAIQLEPSAPVTGA